VRERPAVLRIVFQEIPFQADLRERLFATLADNLRPTFAGFIGRRQSSGEIDPALAPPAVLRIVVSLISGYLLSRLFLFPDLAWDDDREIDQLVGVLVRGLRPAAAGPEPRSLSS
jgi:hypothetical protein